MPALSAHAAIKHLVPWARANVEAACQLAAVIEPYPFAFGALVTRNFQQLPSPVQQYSAAGKASSVQVSAGTTGISGSLRRTGPRRQRTGVPTSDSNLR
jgi:hypothetical protein